MFYNQSLQGTLHIIIIPGGGPNSVTFPPPPGSTKTEIEQFWHMEIAGVIITKFWFGFGTSVGFHPRVSRPDKTNPPPGADFSISPSGFNYDMQSNQSLQGSDEYRPAPIVFPISWGEFEGRSHSYFAGGGVPGPSGNAGGPSKISHLLSVFHTCKVGKHFRSSHVAPTGLWV